MKNLLPFLILVVVGFGCAGLPREDVRADSAIKPLPTIKYSHPTMENAADIYTIMHFEVTNNGTKPIEFLQIHASFYDQDGTLITSESPYIERYTYLGPGERSAATVQTKRDRRIKNYELSFTARGDEPFGQVEVIGSELDPPVQRKGRK